MNNTWTEYTNYYVGGWNYYKYISNFPIANTEEIEANEIDYSTYPAGINVTYFEIDASEYGSIEEIAKNMEEYINSGDEVPGFEQEIIKTKNGYDCVKMKITYTSEPAQVEYLYYVLNDNMVASVDAYSYNLKDDKELGKIAQQVADSFEWVGVEVSE